MSWWLLTSGQLQRMKMAELDKIYIEATGQTGAEVTHHPGTKADLISDLENLKNQERNRAHHSGRQKRPAADLCEITAAECNEFLRSLPVEVPE